MRLLILSLILDLGTFSEAGNHLFYQIDQIGNIFQ